MIDVYEEVLREHGIEIEDDTVPLQIINRMALDAREDEGLVQRFGRVMGEIGFDLEYDEEGEGFEFTSVLEGTSAAVQNAPSAGLTRRGSLDSFLDGSADKIAGTMDVANASPLPLREGRSNDATGHSDIGTWWKKRRSRSDSEVNSNARPHSRNLYSNGSVMIAHQKPLALHQSKPGHGRGSSLSDGERSGRQRDGDSDFYDSDRTGGTADFDPANVYIPGVNAPIPSDRQRSDYHFEPQSFHLSDTRLMDDAETFEQQRLNSLLKSCIRRWRERTQEQIERNEEMMRVAIQYDRRIQFRAVKADLLREAQNRQVLYSTGQFFGRLEDRAARARNLFLLTKAFTHWATSAEDEVMRTSVARRHILRTRFFNGWREITAVNELKIQHFILGKFLSKWRRRVAEVYEAQEQAMQLYDDNLLRKYYKDWFFKFCGLAAPAWRYARLDPRLKRATFQQWHEAATRWTESGVRATNRRNEQIRNRSLEVWRQKTANLQTLKTQAEAFERRSILTKALASIRRHAQFAPLMSRFQQRTGTHRMQSTLQLWERTANLSRQAKSVDRMRVLRNAWTAWNDRLRVKALEERINDRVLVETMYKWTLASRVSLFQRVHNHSLKGGVFLTWVTKRNQRVQTRLTRQNRLDNSEARFMEFKRTQLLRSCLRKIEGATAEKRAEEAAITVQHEMKLKQRVFEKLLAQHDHFQQLNRWAGDAQFYVMTTHAMKKWKDATQHARRNRRREAYAQVRRNVKMNLVRKTLRLWREKAEAIAEQHQQAEEFAYVRTVQNSQILWTHWLDKAANLAAHEVLAEQHHNSKLLARFLDIWNQRLRSVDEMRTQALDFRQIGVEVAAVTLLKKLAWEGWEVQRRQSSADALHERHFKQHVSAMIRFWHQQTRERIEARPSSPSPTSQSRRLARRDQDENRQHHDDHISDGADDERLLDDDAGDETRRLEGWTEFDQSALDLTFSISPQSRPPGVPQTSFLPPSSSSRPVPPRPKTFPPSSALRSAFRPLPILHPLDETDEPDATSTPMPPHMRAGPGYLKTPSKRSVIQYKRTELQGSPEKRIARLGAMSAPPASRFQPTAESGGRPSGMTSFQRKLRDGGYGRSERQSGVKGKTPARGRVEFGDVSHFG